MEEKKKPILEFAKKWEKGSEHIQGKIESNDFNNRVCKEVEEIIKENKYNSASITLGASGGDFQGHFLYFGNKTIRLADKDSSVLGSNKLLRQLKAIFNRAGIEVKVTQELDRSHKYDSLSPVNLNEINLDEIVW